MWFHCFSIGRAGADSNLHVVYVVPSLQFGCIFSGDTIFKCPIKAWNGELCSRRMEHLFTNNANEKSVQVTI